MISDLIRNIMIADVYSKHVSTIIDYPHYVRIYGKRNVSEEEPIMPLTKFTGVDQFESTYITRFCHLFISTVLNQSKQLFLNNLEKQNVNFYRMFSGVARSNILAYGFPIADDLETTYSLQELVKGTNNHLTIKYEENMITGIGPLIFSFPALVLGSKEMIDILVKTIFFKPTTEILLKKLQNFITKRIYASNSNFYSDDLAELMEDCSTYPSSTFSKCLMKACEIVLETNSLMESIYMGMETFNKTGHTVAIIAAILQTMDEKYYDDADEELVEKMDMLRQVEQMTEKYERWLYG